MCNLVMSKILLLITTESNKKKAKRIARLLVKKKLAACVSLKHIFSIYKWEGKIEENEEIEITIKSKPELKDDLIVFLQNISSYEMPQIIFKKFNTEKKYGNWLTKTF